MDHYIAYIILSTIRIVNFNNNQFAVMGKIRLIYLEYDQCLFLGLKKQGGFFLKKENFLHLLILFLLSICKISPLPLEI
jgi:hypothetical protein